MPSPSSLLDLGILIPTWDRPEEVRTRLDEIAAQLGTGQHVHVQVNPGKYGLDEVRLGKSGSAVTRAVNNANVGFTANILYGIPHLSEDWIWILGDDDALMPDCAEKIADKIRHASESTIAIVHNHWHYGPIVKSTCRSGADLIANSGFSDLLFISATVWRRSYLVENLDLFVDQAFSCSGQVALLLFGLESGKGEVLVCGSPLIDFRDVHRWSRVQFIQRMTTLLKLDISRTCKAKLAYSMLPQWIWATRSGLEEVSQGSIGRSLWFASSAAALIRLHFYDPFLSIRYLSEILQIRISNKLVSKKKSLKTFLAQAKGRIRAVLRTY
jgi:glycosyltransferase involved in cell wall biosynthesis